MVSPLWPASVLAGLSRDLARAQLIS